MLALPERRAQQAARFGVRHEDVAREAYVQWRSEQATSLGEALDLEVKAVGLCVWPSEPWLAGSPDAICVSHGLPRGGQEASESTF